MNGWRVEPSPIPIAGKSCPNRGLAGRGPPDACLACGMKLALYSRAEEFTVFPGAGSMARALIVAFLVIGGPANCSCRRPACRIAEESGRA